MTKATPIPLGARLSLLTAEAAQRLYPHRRNWEQPEEKAEGSALTVDDVNNGRYSSRCVYTHWTYRPRILSAGRIVDGRLHWQRGADRPRWFQVPVDTEIISPPHGWRFGEDNLGLYVVRVKENRAEYRYHFHTDDLSNKSTLRAAAIRHEKRQKKAAREARNQQRQSRKREKVRKQALRVGVYVTFRDSVASGNCAVGTRRWAEEHGLNPRKAYPVDVVLRYGERNGNKRQVERAVEAAINRSADDLARGYCVLRPFVAP